MTYVTYKSLLYFREQTIKGMGVFLALCDEIKCTRGREKFGCLGWICKHWEYCEDINIVKKHQTEEIKHFILKMKIKEL